MKFFRIFKVSNSFSHQISKVNCLHKKRDGYVILIKKCFSIENSVSISRGSSSNVLSIRGIFQSESLKIKFSSIFQWCNCLIYMHILEIFLSFSRIVIISSLCQEVIIKPHSQTLSRFVLCDTYQYLIICMLVLGYCSKIQFNYVRTCTKFLIHFRGQTEVFHLVARIGLNQVSSQCQGFVSLGEHR